MSRTETPARGTPTGLTLRERTLFDADWLFHLGDVEAGQAPALNARGWQKLDLPHDWSIAGPIAENNPSGGAGGFYPGGIGWYRKAFIAPPAWAERQVAIEFDGVYWHSDVWINGHHLGHRPNGYVRIAYDLSEHLKIGGPNVLAVRVDNSRQPNSRWYTGSGIYRHVWMHARGELRVARWSPTITTPAVSAAGAKVAVATNVRNDTPSAAAVTLRSTVLDPAGRAVASVESRGDIPAGGEIAFEQALDVADPALWGPDTPHLYTLRSEVARDDRTVDVLDTPFGIREAVFDPDRGLIFNGEPLKMLGVCEHHDAGCVGAAVPDAVLVRRLRILKNMGCNAIRTSHNPPSPALLDLCDQMGLLVIDEVFDEWMVAKKEFGYATLFEKWWRRDLVEWVRRDRNHPCVILWSMGNEVREQFEPSGVEIARNLIAAVADEDPTRPVTCGCNWRQDADVWIAPEFEVMGINGGGGGCFQYKNFHRENPGRTLYASEVPHTLQTRGAYQTVTHYRDWDRQGQPDPRHPIQQTPDLAAPEVFEGLNPHYRSSYDNAYVRINCRDSWALTSGLDYFAGEFRWTGFDYLGESLGWPRRCWNFGIIDLCGFPKDAYYFYQSRWTATPMVHILPHWTWPGREKKLIPVVAYSNCEEVELLLNGRSLGRKSMGDDIMDLTWLAPYEPGMIEAVGYNSGEPVARKRHATAQAASAVQLTLDRQDITADNRDVAHLTVEIVDANGVMVPHADNRVRFEVTGPGRIIGVDNGDPIDLESTKADHRKAFNGMCLAIVQSTAEAGVIQVAASSEGLRGGEVAITTTREA